MISQEEDERFPLSESEAVRVEHAYKSYRITGNVVPVLSNMCMSVPGSSIYALLGASGCGKTTLLSCILTLQKLDSGHIKVFGKRTGGIRGRNVGYMPQELALHACFKIREMLYLFGQIQGMKKGEIKKRAQYLYELLDIPDENRFIADLSGGQQRRVSLAVALIHEPKLLILDEPTVGIDCVLRARVWQHLEELVAKRTTIIITTHYVEEARCSGRIGLMYKGRLLDEGEPRDLLMRHSSDSIEEMFLKLCQNCAETDNEEAISPAIRGPSLSAELLQTVKRSSCCSSNSEDESIMKGFSAMLWKYTVLLIRHYMLLAMFIAIPVGTLIMCGLACGGPPIRVPVAVVNGEDPELPICEPHSYCYLGNLSCNLLAAMDQNMVDFRPYRDKDSAVDAIRSGDVVAAVTIPAQYTDNLASRILKGVEADQSSLNGSQIELTLDRTGYQTSFYLHTMTLTALEKLTVNTLKKCRMTPEAVSLPIAIDEPIYGTRYPQFKEFLLLPLIAVFVLFSAMVYSTSTYVNVKNSGVFDRLWVSGMSSRTMFLSALVLQFGFLVLLFAVSMAIAVYMFGVIIEGSVIWTFVLLLSQGASSIAIANLQTLFIDDSLLNVQVVVLYMLASLLLGGVIWPIECHMYYPFRYLIQAMPLTLSIESLRSIVLRGWEPWHKYVWAGFVVPIGYTILCISLLLYFASQKKGTVR